VLMETANVSSRCCVGKEATEMLAPTEAQRGSVEDGFSVASLPLSLAVSVGCFCR